MKTGSKNTRRVAEELAMKLFGGSIPEVWGGGTKVQFYLVPKVMCSERAKKAIIAKYGKSYKGHEIYFEISETHPYSTTRPLPVELL